ncbi:Sperm-associated antigen 4 protein [Boothiomyces sp. JEL0866]|nr:Sperm-associated antigen 4 protein [Boothiomyces sp. JEL0866]
MESPRVLRERKILNYATTPFKKPARPGKSRKDPFIESLEDSPAPAIRFLASPGPSHPLRKNIFEDTNIPSDEDEELLEQKETFYIIDWLSDLSFFPYAVSQISVVASVVVLLFLGMFQLVCLPYTLVLMIRNKLSKRIVYYIKTSLLIFSMVVLLLFLFRGKDLPVKLSKQNDSDSSFHLPEILKHPVRGGSQTPEIVDLELSQKEDIAEVDVARSLDRTELYEDPDISEIILKDEESQVEPNDSNVVADSVENLQNEKISPNMEDINREMQIKQERDFKEFKKEILNLQDVQEIHIENILQRLEMIELELMNIDSIKSEIGEIKQIIEKDRLELDIVKKYGPNYALEALGATVSSSKPIRSKTNNPANILQGAVTAGKCFGIAAKNSFIEIQLNKKINVKAVIIRHLTTFSNESKPRELVIMGNSVIFAKEQDYLIQLVDTKTDRVRIDIKSNWGKDYTCLYSVQVHGSE